MQPRSIKPSHLPGNRLSTEPNTTSSNIAPPRRRREAAIRPDQATTISQPSSTRPSNISQLSRAANMASSTNRPEHVSTSQIPPAPRPPSTRPLPIDPLRLLHPPPGAFIPPPGLNFRDHYRLPNGRWLGPPYPPFPQGREPGRKPQEEPERAQAPTLLPAFDEDAPGPPMLDPTEHPPESHESSLEPEAPTSALDAQDPQDLSQDMPILINSDDLPIDSNPTGTGIAHAFFLDARRHLVRQGYNLCLTPPAGQYREVNIPRGILGGWWDRFNPSKHAPVRRENWLERGRYPEAWSEQIIQLGELRPIPGRRQTRESDHASHTGQDDGEPWLSEASGNPEDEVPDYGVENAGIKAGSLRGGDDDVPNDQTESNRTVVPGIDRALLQQLAMEEAERGALHYGTGHQTRPPTRGGERQTGQGSQIVHIGAHKRPRPSQPDDGDSSGEDENDEPPRKKPSHHGVGGGRGPSKRPRSPEDEHDGDPGPSRKRLATGRRAGPAGDERRGRSPSTLPTPAQQPRLGHHPPRIAGSMPPSDPSSLETFTSNDPPSDSDTMQRFYMHSDRLRKWPIPQMVRPICTVGQNRRNWERRIPFDDGTGRKHFGFFRPRTSIMLGMARKLDYGEKPAWFTQPEHEPKSRRDRRIAWPMENRMWRRHGTLHYRAAQQDQQTVWDQGSLFERTMNELTNAQGVSRASSAGSSHRGNAGPQRGTMNTRGKTNRRGRRY